MSQHTGPGTVGVCRAAAGLLTSAFVVLILTASFAAAQALPSGWTATNVGAATPVGRATYTSGTFTIEGGGREIEETADRFYFVHQQMTGNGTIIARVGTIEYTAAGARAGVMMRESLNAGSRHGFVAVSAARGVTFTRRTTTGGASAIKWISGKAPMWVRLVRSGSTFTASSSTNGTSWTTIGSQTISMASTIYVGLAVSSYNNSSLATGTFSNVTTPAVSTLPSGWTGADIGSPAAAGSSAYASGAYTIVGGGTDIFGTSDQFHFAHRQASGDVDVVTRVASLQGPDQYSKAGIMIRSSLAANAPHVMAFLSATNGTAMQSRPATGLTTIQSGRASGTAPVWFKLERRGSAITAFRSNDGSTWSMIGSTTLTLPSTFYVGLVVTARHASATATAQFTNVSTPSASTPANTPPTVSLTSPASGATFTASTNVSIAANAADTDNGIALVEFYANGTLLGTDASSPYAFSWSNVGAGTYSLTAIARDNGGATTTSAARSITVNAATSANVPPTVSLTAPASGSTYVAPATVTISANAADSDGSVARVDFYAGSLLVGSDTTSPYSVTWTNAGAGSYAVTAVARDNAGATTTSGSRGITITAAQSLTKALFVASADHATVIRYELEIFTSGANPSTATPIATQDLGKPAVVNGECSADIAATISGLPGGSYFATVSAVSSGGTSPPAISTAFTR